MNNSKQYEISKQYVYRAYQMVKRNKGSAGIDGVDFAEYEENLKGNLYKLWNRMSSGSYFPSAVKAVEIPKKKWRGQDIGNTNDSGQSGTNDSVALH